ncbi:hypothetical protein Cgig2_033565 [Carnegiea gigantea]|uniref:Cytochrome P450 n=1 Tax=Carnegiea gigantea TaxID=171969 RepID=A0A9Q1KM24_9CARY|nr:hypothetical protein Cgig2_033565 [Carnegiea gigantea]
MLSTPAEVDVLPSGHKVDPNMQIIFDMYAMGRMKSIWEEDCCDFKSERWISETGKIRHEPSPKFLAFNSGPRTCIGKNMSLTIMKVAIMTIISKYNIEPVQGHPIVPNGLPTNWPVIGMLPALLKNQHRIHDYAVEVLEKTELTFLLRGPWFTNMKLLFIVDPANVHHILSKNFGNYPRGSKFKEISEVLGDGIFTIDLEMWQCHRRMAQSAFGHPEFHQFLVEKVWDKIESGLIPFLDHAFEQRLEIDLFSFDTISTVVMDYDPGCLSIDLPNLPFLKALHDFEEVIVYRHVVPTCVWKFQRWLGIGQEKKHREALKIIDDFVYGYMDEVRTSAEIESNHDKFLKDAIVDLKDKLIYLHAAVCEALRLYPLVPFNTKVPIEPDTLPSGHKVDSSMQIIFSMYAVGRMKSLWGEDCYEFKPERWILGTGKIRYVPSHQFLAFSTGPRTCVGKNMALTMLKAATIAIIGRYHIEPKQAHPIVPNASMILHMKQGFKVNVSLPS